MRAMRPCATASAALIGIIAAAGAFAACSGGPTPSQHPEDSAPPPSATTPAPPPAEASADMPEPAANKPPRPKKTPETVADCKQMLSEITNEPPEGGVVMNNATTAADAGSSDRLQPLVDVIKSRRDGFRCCFDLYARKNPGARGKITWQLKLKPDGAVEEATIVREKSDVSAPEIESCMADLARSVTWARSPSGKDTTLTYPFDFKSR
jgi:hypothetical protein